MTTQQENYINSRLEAYRRELEVLDAGQIEREVLGALEAAELEERERLEADEPELRGADYEAHMEKFRKDTEKELFDYYKGEHDKENYALVEEYRLELERELEAETE